MSMHKFLSIIVALATSAYAVSPIEVQEQEFVDSVSGDRFNILGIDYAPGGQASYGMGADSFSDPEACLRDAALMQNLGLNTIRSYNLDPTLNHDECMSIFNSVGIYTIIDVNSPLPGQSLDRSNPSGSYNTGYLTHVFNNIEAFKDYPNVLGFFAGNEIINDVPTAQDNPPYIRAVQRDMKNYIANHANRTIPVGYSAADVDEVLEDTWNYLQCSLGDNDNSQSDFFGLNDYSWCGTASSFTTSGYDGLVTMFSDSSIPIFFSEYGCNMPRPRAFDEVLALYSPEMTVMSGGLVFEWTEEGDHFGLLSVNSDGSATLLPDYNTLASQYGKLNTTFLTTQNDTATNIQPPQCDSSLITNSQFSTDFNIPDTPSDIQQLIDNGISDAPSGSIVSVTKTSVQVAVTQVNGAPVQDLQITPAAQANLPGEHSGLETGTAPSSSRTSSSGASNTDSTSTTDSSSSTATSDGAASATSSGAAATIDLGVVGHGAMAGLFGIAAYVL